MNDTAAPRCVFCAIAKGTEPAEVICRWPDAIAIRPLDPVADGHLLVIPRAHAEDALDDPLITAVAMHRAAQLGNQYGMKQPGMGLNFITSVGSVGAPATRDASHLHIHIIPRLDGDGLALPWTSQGDTRSHR